MEQLNWRSKIIDHKKTNDNMLFLVSFNGDNYGDEWLFEYDFDKYSYLIEIYYQENENNCIVYSDL